MFFHEVPEGQPDAIFGLSEAFAADPRPHKISLVVGIYQNERMQSELMASVRKAKEQSLPDDLMADYLPIDGARDLIEGLGALLFGEAVWRSSHGQIYGAQTVGGTSALRMGAEFLAQTVTRSIFIPAPTWPNHRAIFERAGCRVETYPYYHRDRHGFDLEAMLDQLQQMPEKSAVLLHAACHNPTGCDPTREEWREIAKAMRDRNLIAFFDCAYQGLGDGLEADAAGLRHFVQEGHEILVAYSCSKNFSLYCQRVGALFVVDENAAVKLRVGSQIKRIVRACYSNPPAHGARIVSHILKGSLRAAWESELDAMRKRMEKNRRELIRRLMAKAKKTDFSYLAKHKGMFSFLDLSKHQVQRLIDEYAIYLPDPGRINVSALNESHLDRVVDGLIAVCESL